MPKAPLTPELSILEGEIIETLLAGLQKWRPDLRYPESHSDMEACVRALLRMYKVERRPIAEPLRYPCDACEGIGKFIDRTSTPNFAKTDTCGFCRGRGYTLG